jgi:membrane protease YdiL (CAAX protease family)
VTFDRRVFGLLLALNALAGMAGVPYQRAFAEQGYGGELLLALPLATAYLLFALGQLVIAAPCAALGVGLGPRLGLRTPWLTALAGGTPEGPPAGRVVREAALWGVGAGLLLSLTEFVPFLDVMPELVRLGIPIPKHPPVWAGVLGSFSAGVAEETILRLGLFTAVAWLGSRVLRGARPAAEWTPPPAVFHAANVVAALAFAALHFVNVEAFGFPFTPAIVLSVLVGNGAVGLLCGWLYWKRGIEAAMIAHTAVDLVIHGFLPAFLPDPAG